MRLQKQDAIASLNSSIASSSGSSASEHMPTHANASVAHHQPNNMSSNAHHFQPAHSTDQQHHHHHTTESPLSSLPRIPAISPRRRSHHRNPPQLLPQMRGAGGLAAPGVVPRGSYNGISGSILLYRHRRSMVNQQAQEEYLQLHHGRRRLLNMLAHSAGSSSEDDSGRRGSRYSAQRRARREQKMAFIREGMAAFAAATSGATGTTAQPLLGGHTAADIGLPLIALHQPVSHVSGGGGGTVGPVPSLLGRPALAEPGATVTKADIREQIQKAKILDMARRQSRACMAAAAAAAAAAASSSKPTAKSVEPAIDAASIVSGHSSIPNQGLVLPPIRSHADARTIQEEGEDDFQSRGPSVVHPPDGHLQHRDSSFHSTSSARESVANATARDKDDDGDTVANGSLSEQHHRASTLSRHAGQDGGEDDEVLKAAKTMLHADAIKPSGGGVASVTTSSLAESRAGGSFADKQRRGSLQVAASVTDSSSETVQAGNRHKSFANQQQQQSKTSRRLSQSMSVSGAPSSINGGISHYAQGPQKPEPRRMSVFGSMIPPAAMSTGAPSSDAGYSTTSVFSSFSSPTTSNGELRQQNDGASGSQQLMAAMKENSTSSLKRVMSITYLMKEKTISIEHKEAATSIPLQEAGYVKSSLLAAAGVVANNPRRALMFARNNSETNPGSGASDPLQDGVQEDEMDAESEGGVSKTSKATTADTQAIMARAGIVPQLPAQRLPLQAQPPPQQQQQQQQQLQSPPYAFLDIASLIRQAVKVQTPMSCLRNHKSPAFESLRVATIVLSPRERWLFAIRTVVKLLHNLKHTVHTGGRKIDNAPGVNERSLTYALKEFQYQADLILSTKIQQYLDKKLPKTEDEIAMLNRLLMTRMTSFAKYNYDQRIRFCNAMSYEAHRKGSVIIRQGHLPYYFYFILSGQMEVLKDRSDGFTGQLRLTLLNQGDCFGEVALDGSYQERRTTTVICTAPCEFLRIDKDDYRNIIIGEDSVSDVMTRIRLLRNVPVFALADDQILEQAVLKTQVRHYERNSVILKENDSNKRLFFIVSGKCRIEKSIQLFRKYAVGNGDYRLRPDRKSTQPIRKGEERIQETVSLAEIHEGASFPEPLPAGVVASTTADRLDLISKINDHDALSLNRSYVSVIAVNPVVCITMERIDFARIMSWGMLKNLLDSSILFSIPVEAMQDQFVIQKGWDAYKRKIVEEMMLRRTGEKWVKRNGWQQWQNQAMCRL